APAATTAHPSGLHAPQHVIIHNQDPLSQQTLEAQGVGRGHQLNVYRALASLLRDAFEKGVMADNPLRGVQKPEYAPQRVAIPEAEYITKAIQKADHQLALEIVLMVGCGLRNGEARAVNVNNMVADDVYRVTEQVHSSTHQLAKLKHRKEGEFREVPLPRTVKDAIERFADEHGATEDGYLLREPKGPFSEPNERYRVAKLFKALPPTEGVGMYSFRHFFASNALSHGIPITDVADWMGHKKS
ncbi:tyrosine-type recombinase/integrase, partial [Streptomyces hirsutus]|uniref:tyrosine-type recombinase/integrase n=1 Tax=Streptomyces hirsutus TaxID=35620 RepID=UPI00364A59EB